jgi:hypothetical protein
MNNSKYTSRQFFTLKTAPLDQRIQHHEYVAHIPRASNEYDYGMGMHQQLQGRPVNPVPQPHPQQQHHKVLSNLNDYLFKAQILVVQILKCHTYGIDADRLYAILNDRLGSNFDPSIFNVETFNEFLVTYLDDCLDIEVKKGAKNRGNNS